MRLPFFLPNGYLQISMDSITSKTVSATNHCPIIFHSFELYRSLLHAIKFEQVISSVLDFFLFLILPGSGKHRTFMDACSSTMVQ